MEHQGTKTLESDRLILRKFRVSDAQAMYENWASDPEVTKYLMWQHHENAEATKSVLLGWVCHYDEKGYYQWAITLKENGDIPIGSIGVVKREDSVRLAHVGYCIGRKWWNQGITSEAFGLVIDFLFGEVGMNRIEARHDPKNSNSGKVMVKCGLTYEGTLRESDRNNQGICDAAYYSILRNDYIMRVRVV